LSAVGEGDAVTHPWVRRDPVTGARSLELPPPLPSPQVARELAGALSAIADSLRGSAVR